MREDVRDAVVGGAWIFLGGLVTSLTGFVFVIIVARLVGVDAIGVASMMLSSASIAVTIVSAGLNIAVVREVAAGGLGAVRSALVLGVLLGSLAALISVPLATLIQGGLVSTYAPLMAFLSLLSLVLTSCLWGLELFRYYTLSLVVASVIKLGVASVLALLGFKLLSPILGYLAYPLTSSLIAGSVLLTYVRRLGGGRSSGSFRDVIEIIKLSLSNYPYMFSNQLITMLSVYLFAYIIKVAVSTGTLYISLMITLAIASLPGAILSASLPISTKRGSDVFSESFRIGLSLATPITIFISIAAPIILNLINPALLGGVFTLRVLLLAIPPLVALNATLYSLNRLKSLKALAILGITRLAILIAVLVGTVRVWGIVGAAVAFLVANIATLPVALKFVKYEGMIKNLMINWGLLTALTVPAMLIPTYNGLLTATTATIASVAILHITKVMRVSEVINVAKIIATDFLRRRA